MSQNIIEKIAQQFTVNPVPGQEIRSGDFIQVQPAHVLTHDNTGAVLKKFQAIGAKKMAHPRQPVYALDHNVQDTGEANMQKYARIEEFARHHGVDFYPAGRGIGHQIMCEEGYVWPGSFVVASDSHSNMYGGLGALGTPVVRTDAAAIWATGQTWWQVPPIARIKLQGELPPGVTGKDVIIALCGLFNNDEVLNHALEFTGPGVSTLTVDQRLTIANMTTEWGALAGVFPTDAITIKWLEDRIAWVAQRGPAGVPSDTDNPTGHPRLNTERLAELRDNPLFADPDAFYSRTITLDLTTVQPHIAGPDNLKNVQSVAEAFRQDIQIHKAYLVSCVNSRVEDLAEAAKVVAGKSVAEGVEFYVAAASSEVQAESERRGDWQKLIDAGAIILPPGCGPCIGLGRGLLGENEVAISATNRNFKGRMGARSARAFLASPAVVAASAVTGRITAPNESAESEPLGTMEIHSAPKSIDKEVTLLPDFPESITGRLLWLYQNNLNTDGIYPGTYTYQDDITPEQQAEVAMENYDTDFQQIAEEGDILVGGYNFGSGSSREQAATCLKYRGIQLVLAGSFSETYKRNAINNGFLVLDAPDLVEDLRTAFGEEKLTIATDRQATIDFRTARITVNQKSYKLNPVGTAAQELILKGGLESWVKARLI